jgi:tetratricopeptide (TPR) repeat protein
MKKILLFVFSLLLSAATYSQGIADYLMKAKAYNAVGSPEKAIGFLSGLTETGTDFRLLLERAEARLLKGDYSAAISDFNEANRISPYAGEYGLARIYALKGDASTSLYHLGLNLSSALKKSEKEIFLDPAFTPVENTPAWRQFWKREWYSTEEKAISEIEYYATAGKTEDARVLLASVKKNFSVDQDVVYAEALLNYSSGKYSEVITAVRIPSSTDRRYEKTLRLLAKAQISLSNFAGASVTFSQLLESGVADAELYLNRAECYRKTGEGKKAIDDIEKYLGLYPENRKALSLAGKTESENGDNLKALKYFSDNLKLHPGDPECYIDRANSYLMSKSWDWAIKDYSMSLDLNPANADAWLNMGVANLSTGRSEEACHDFMKAFSLGSKRASELISKNCIK